MTTETHLEDVEVVHDNLEKELLHGLPVVDVAVEHQNALEHKGKLVFSSPTLP